MSIQLQKYVKGDVELGPIIEGPFKSPESNPQAPHPGIVFANTQLDWLHSADGVLEPPTLEKKYKGIKLRAGKVQPSSKDAANRIAEVLTNSFHKMAKKVVATASKKMELKKASGDEADVVNAIMKAIQEEFARVPDAVESDLVQAALRGVQQGAFQLDITDNDLISKVNGIAKNWAQERAAELVGMTYDDDGTLVENPNPKWAITESTRDQLRTIITDVFSADDASMSTLEDRIQQAGTFSESRAKMIAKTEVISAEVNGNLDIWQESGLVEMVDWVLSGDHDDGESCECSDNADGGPYEIDVTPDFPAHPNCECILVAAKIAEE